jgi:heme/copper-type cytochrome/quinol oxidase subunit 1
MSSEVAVPDSTHSARFEESLAAEQAAERGLFVTITKTILISLPIMIGIFLLIPGLAISDKSEWYVWVGMGVGLGFIGAVLLGSLAGATLAAHRLDAIDHDTYG